MAIGSEKYMSILSPLAKVPVVNTYGDHRVPPFPQVDVNNYQVGKVAAEYFLQKGFQSFLSVENPYSKERCRGFQETLQTLGFDSQHLSLEGANWEDAITQSGVKKILRYLKNAQGPTAVYCEHDQLAQQMISFLQEQGFHVPSDVAVLGTQNDDLTCESYPPYISSIKMPYEEVGYEAARVLELLLRKGKASARPVLLKPLEVVERQSTDILAVPDPNVQKAITYIKANACGPIHVTEIARASGLSLRVLQIHFRNTLGYTLQAEIRRVRILRAKELLLDTDLNLDEISEQAAFSNKGYLCSAFRTATGMTPGNYRKHFKT